MRAWAVFCARVVLGLIFGMAGFYKCFVMTPAVHAERLFITPYAETWIPIWLLWITGVAIPIVELIAGWLLVVGWRVRESLVALGLVLILVTYGHLLLEPLYSFSGHVFPRLVLLILVAMLGAEHDWLSVDYLLSSRRSRTTLTAANRPG
jgi:thiosulfate dehydrogenase (quinone) large subunit